MCLDHEALPHPAPLVKGHAAWGWARGAGSMAPGKTKNGVVCCNAVFATKRGTREPWNRKNAGVVGRPGGG